MLRFLPCPLHIAGMTLVAILTTGPKVVAQAELDGVWFAGALGVIENLNLTPAGEARHASYDHLTDDAAMQCIPSTFTRVMNTPSPPIEIRQHENYVEVNYEFMDIRRRIPLDPTLALDDAPVTVTEHPHMGRSIGRYEGETLVVDTAGQEAGVLDTVADPGLPQSEQMRTQERFTADGDRMQVVVTHHDPVNYTTPLVVRFNYVRLDSEILEWGCTVEEAGYGRFASPQR